MKKIVYSSFFMLLCTNMIIAQELLPSIVKDTINEECDSDAIHQDMMQKDSLYRKKMEDFEKLMEANKMKKDEEVVEIPLAIYILHNGEPVGNGVNITNKAVFGVIENINMILKYSGKGKIGGKQKEVVIIGDSLGIIRYDLSENKKYRKNGIAASWFRSGLKEKDLIKLSEPNLHTCFNIFVVDKINKRSCMDNSRWSYNYIPKDFQKMDDIKGVYVLDCVFTERSQLNKIIGNFLYSSCPND